MRARVLLAAVMFVGVLGIGGLASVYTAGVVVPPSYAGQTVVAGPHGLGELTGTAMTLGPPGAGGPLSGTAYTFGGADSAPAP
jgi:hypothetical protein